MMTTENMTREDIAARMRATFAKSASEREAGVRATAEELRARILNPVTDEDRELRHLILTGQTSLDVAARDVWGARQRLASRG